MSNGKQFDRSKLVLAVWSAEFVRALYEHQSRNGVAMRQHAEDAARSADRTVEALRLLVDDVEFRPASDDAPEDCRMTWEDFVGACQSGGFTNDDGCGELATVNCDPDGRVQVYVSSVRVYPGDALDKRYERPEWATHVVWYNK